MASHAGRITRIVAGAALVVLGVALGGGYLALSAVGLVPLAAGLFDFCIFAPLGRMPFMGKAFREGACSR
jgi:hypothetical protein